MGLVPSWNKHQGMVALIAAADAEQLLQLQTKGHRCASEELNYNTLKMFAAAVASLSVGGQLPSPAF